jgi:transcriptional regulator with XRE-family HTH domain
MKQEAVAHKMGISKQRYSELENHPNLRDERILEILAALNLTSQEAKKLLASVPPQ